LASKLYEIVKCVYMKLGELFDKMLVEEKWLYCLDLREWLVFGKVIA